MSMAYFASFDRRLLPQGAIHITRSGGGTIDVFPRLLNFNNGYNAQAYYYNHVITRNWSGMDYGHTNLLKAFSGFTFYQAITQMLRTAADAAGWPATSTLDIDFSATTRRTLFQYPTGITAITFDSDALRRLFGLAYDYDITGVTGYTTIEYQLPTHIIEPTVDGASSASTVYETDAISCAAYSAGGRAYSIARSQAPLRRKWVQPYETRAKTFQRYAAAAPDEYTFEDLYKDCRSSLPFAVIDGFADEGALSAYVLENGSENFHAQTVVPGSYDQFHILFQTMAVGRA